MSGFAAEAEGIRLLEQASMLNVFPRLAIIALVAACASSSTASVAVVGVARERATGYPWRSGIASLYADTGQTVAPIATAPLECGFFRLVAPVPGSYRIRVAMIGLSAALEHVRVDSTLTDTLEFRGRHVAEMPHNDLFESVMRPGECPATSYGEPGVEDSVRPARG